MTIYGTVQHPKTGVVLSVEEWMETEGRKRMEEAKSRTTKDVLVLAVLGDCWVFHTINEEGMVDLFNIEAMLWDL